MKTLEQIQGDIRTLPLEKKQALCDWLQDAIEEEMEIAEGLADSRKRKEEADEE